MRKPLPAIATVFDARAWPRCIAAGLLCPAPGRARSLLLGTVVHQPGEERAPPSLAKIQLLRIQTPCPGREPQ